MKVDCSYKNLWMKKRYIVVCSLNGQSYGNEKFMLFFGFIKTHVMGLGLNEFVLM
jgi:hypothetical protein